MNDVDPETYCRELETYLCRKNDGHLIRIVGPAFEQVCGWAMRGVPLKIAQQGIDRYFARYYAKGPRRRPVRVEFCEPDVLDVFDEWRRAVGVPAAPQEELVTSQGSPGPNQRQFSLPAHLDRTIARLTSLRSGPERGMDDVLDSVVRELDAARAAAKSLRGEAREHLLERLRALDSSLLQGALKQCDETMVRELETAAVAELAPFRDRMAPDAYQRSHAACVERGLRERFRLPTIAYE